MNVCDICDRETGGCRFCVFGNPCLYCKDYDIENDSCKSDGGCGKEQMKGETDVRRSKL